MSISSARDADPIRTSEGFVTWGIAIAAATVAAQSVGHLVGVRLLDDEYLHLNADDELGVPAWVSASATFAAAFGVLLCALLAEEVDAKLVALAGLLAFISLDDAVVIHERIGEKGAEAFGYGEDASRVIWPALYLPLLLAGMALLVYAARRLPTRLARLVYWGLGLFTLALAAEGASLLLYADAGVERGSWPDAIEVIVEEGAELVGSILLATAFFAEVLRRLLEDRAARTGRMLED